MTEATDTLSIHNEFDSRISDITHMARIVSLMVAETLDGIAEGRHYGEDDLERAKFAAFHLEDMTRQLQKDWLAQPAVARRAA